MYHQLLAESVNQIVTGTTTPALQLQMRPWSGGGWWWGFGFLWPLFWLLVLSGLIGITVYLLTRRNDSTNADPALVVLRERYARGEIDEEEFEKRLSHLQNQP